MWWWDGNLNLRELGSGGMGEGLVVVGRNRGEGRWKWIDIYFVDKLVVLLLWF